MHGKAFLLQIKRFLSKKRQKQEEEHILVQE
jgi:hypothetical protein